MSLTPERMAELQAEAQTLIAELKRRYADRGIAGVPNIEFVSRWQGVRAEEAEGAPSIRTAVRSCSSRKACRPTESRAGRVTRMSS
jgi:hypothetical protein